MAGKKLISRINSAAVTAYKVVGFAVLAVILIGLVSYIGTQAFFAVSSSWLAPVIVAPGDDRILEVNEQIAQQSAARDRLVSDRAGLERQRSQAERIIAVETGFQQGFRLALEEDGLHRRRELGALRVLRHRYAAARDEISRSSRAYSELIAARAEALVGARLMDDESHTGTRHELAQIAHAALRLEAEQREIEASISAIGGGVRKMELLMLEKEYTRSTLELARAEQEHAAAGDSLRSIDASIERYERLLAAVRGSPYLEAIEGGITVAFVPYDNLEEVSPGDALYACHIGLVGCSRAGEVVRILEGELTMKHPVRNVTVRGEMVEIKLRDRRWAQKTLLHADRPPLWF